MSLAKLKEKYNPLPVVAGHTAPAMDPEARPTPADYDDHRDSSGAPVLASWQDSAPVVRLSIYVKEHGATAGIRLMQRKSIPALIIRPGVRTEHHDRWKILENAFSLLLDASIDLSALIRNGKLHLPAAPGHAGGSFLETSTSRVL